jgi:hypothetical protein
MSRRPRPEPEHRVDLLLWHRDGVVARVTVPRAPSVRFEIQIGRTPQHRLGFVVSRVGPKGARPPVVEFVLTRAEVTRLRGYLGPMLPRVRGMSARDDRPALTQFWTGTRRPGASRRRSRCPRRRPPGP